MWSQERDSISMFKAVIDVSIFALCLQNEWTDMKKMVSMGKREAQTPLSIIVYLQHCGVEEMHPNEQCESSCHLGFISLVPLLNT